MRRMRDDRRSLRHPTVMHAINQSAVLGFGSRGRVCLLATLTYCRLRVCGEGTGTAVGRVRPSVCFHSRLMNQHSFFEQHFTDLIMTGFSELD